MAGGETDMIDRPTPNPPPPGYAEGLSSFLYEPLKLGLKEEIEKSGYFPHVSAVFPYVTNPEYDDWFPNIQIHIPGHANEPYGLAGKIKMQNITVEIYYYAKHLNEVGYSSNEISHFIEFMSKIIAVKKKLSLETDVCIYLKGVESSETDFYVNGEYLISMGMVTVLAMSPDCVIPADETEI